MVLGVCGFPQRSFFKYANSLINASAALHCLQVSSLGKGSSIGVAVGAAVGATVLGFFFSEDEGALEAADSTLASLLLSVGSFFVCDTCHRFCHSERLRR